MIGSLLGVRRALLLTSCARTMLGPRNLAKSLSKRGLETEVVVSLFNTAAVISSHVINCFKFVRELSKARTYIWMAEHHISPKMNFTSHCLGRTNPIRPGLHCFSCTSTSLRINDTIRRPVIFSNYSQQNLQLNQDLLLIVVRQSATTLLNSFAAHVTYLLTQGSTILPVVKYTSP